MDAQILIFSSVEFVGRRRLPCRSPLQMLRSRILTSRGIIFCNRKRCSSLSAAEASRPSRSPQATSLGPTQRQDVPKRNPLAAPDVALLTPLSTVEKQEISRASRKKIPAAPRRLTEREQELEWNFSEGVSAMQIDQGIKMFTTSRKETAYRSKWLKFMKDTNLQADTNYICTGQIFKESIFSIENNFLSLLNFYI